VSGDPAWHAEEFGDTIDFYTAVLFDGRTIVDQRVNLFLDQPRRVEQLSRLLRSIRERAKFVQSDL
jgi:hypothetical protein